MTFLQMECFLNAAKFQSYSKAAENLYISQPTLSRQIQALESELGVVLFSRENNLMQLTPVGRKMMPKLESLFQSYCSTTEQLREIAGSNSGRLRIGIQSGHALDFRIRTACHHIQISHPEATVLVCHRKQKESYVSLMDESIDLLLALNLTMPPTDKLDSMTIYQDYMCLAVPVGHRNANLPVIHHKEISAYFPDLTLYCMDPVEFSAPMASIEQCMEPALRQHTVALTGSYADQDTLMMMVDAGLGMTLIHSRSILSGNPRVKLISIIDPPTEANCQTAPTAECVYWHKKNTNPLLHEFLSALKDLF